MINVNIEIDAALKTAHDDVEYDNKNSWNHPSVTSSSNCLTLNKIKETNQWKYLKYGFVIFQLEAVFKVDNEVVGLVMPLIDSIGIDTFLEQYKQAA